MLYDALRDEVLKIGTLHEDTINWGYVFSLSEKLADHDLRIYSYYCRAAGEVKGLSEVAVSLGKVCSAVEDKWESLLPAGERQRISSLESISGHLEYIFTKYSLSADDEPALKACFGSLERLQQLLQHRLGNKAPSFRPARVLAVHYLNTLQKKKNAEEEALVTQKDMALLMALDAPLVAPIPPSPFPVQRSRRSQKIWRVGMAVGCFAVGGMVVGFFLLNDTFLSDVKETRITYMKLEPTPLIAPLDAEPPNSFEKMQHSVQGKLDVLASQGSYPDVEADIASLLNHTEGGQDTLLAGLQQQYKGALSSFFDALPIHLEEKKTALVSWLSEGSAKKVSGILDALRNGIIAIDLRNTRTNIDTLWKMCSDDLVCQGMVEQYATLLTVHVIQEPFTAQRYSKALQIFAMMRQIFPNNLFLTEWEKRVASFRSRFIVGQALEKRSAPGLLESQALHQLKNEAPALFAGAQQEVKAFLQAAETTSGSTLPPEIKQYWQTILEGA